VSSQLSAPADGRGESRHGNVADLVRVAAQRHGERVALLARAGRRTWTEVDAAVDSGVAAVRSAGVRPGDRVLMALTTGPDQAAALFAVMRAGLVAVQVEPTHPDLAWVGRRVGAALAITDRHDHGCDRRIPAGELGAWWGTAAGVRHPAAGGGEDLALLARSGRPAAPVMLSHRAVLAAVRAALAAPGFDLSPDDRLVQALPLYHVVGLLSTFLPAAVAGAAVVVPDLGAPGRTPAESVLAAIRAEGVTVLPAEPTLYRQLCQADGFADAVATVRLMACGSAALDPVHLHQIREASGLTVRQGYGISESAATVTSTLMTTVPGGEPREGSVGLPYPGIAIRVLSDDEDAPDLPTAPVPSAANATSAATTTPAAASIGTGDASPGDAGPDDRDPDRTRDAAARDDSVDEDSVSGDGDTLAEVSDDGGIGRIAISGPTLFSGYWPGGSGGPDADGWFVSGDIGYLDDDGELHLIDRMTETVVVSGFTVYPREVESVLGRHPAVADAAVIGTPSPTGSAVAAVIVLRDGTAPTVAELDEFLSDKLAPFKRPSAFQVVAVLPRTEVGRLDRDALRSGFASGEGILPPVVAGPDAVAPPTDATGQVPDGDADRTRKASPDGKPAGPVPEPAAELSQLGSRLPAVGSRAGRGADDTDDDLF
jgi:long-chain acyl-CoA synthetase